MASTDNTDDETLDASLTPAEREELAQRLDDTLDVMLFGDEPDAPGTDPDQFDWRDTHLSITVYDIPLPTAASTRDIAEYDPCLEMAIEQAARKGIQEHLPLVAEDANLTVSAAYWQPDEERYSSNP